MDKNKNNEKAGADGPGAEESIQAVKFEPLSGAAAAKPVSIRRQSVVIALSLLLCAAAALFLFTARAVYIETTPAFASIKLDGLLKLKLADRYLLLRGEYPLLLRASGYHDLETTLAVSSEQDQRYSFALERLPGHLQVRTGPVTGAEIFIDEEPVGFTPTTVRDIAPGKHELRIVAERYFPFEETIEIEGRDREQQLQASLVPAWAEVRLETQPPGAEIHVDDELLGQTPFTAELLQGKHNIRLKLPGYKLWQDELNIIANQPVDLTGIQLALADAVIFLASDPPRASATIDGEYKGLTPLEIALTPGKTSAVRLFKQGYQSASRSIKVASGEEKRLLVKLAAELVEVEFKVVPADASLYINGKRQDRANMTVELPAKPHRIEVRKDGFISFEDRITPHTGIAQQVNVTLKSERQARLENIKPVYTTNAGQTVKLFYPTAFTMGASRREPGRRANETIRNIELKRPFYLGIHEVTNEQYRKFKNDHTSGAIEGRSLDGDKQPVVKVTWEQAAAYCNWLSEAESLKPFYTVSNKQVSGFDPSANGFRLPTEAEWAWAARVTGKGQTLKFPWGDKMPPPPKSGNYADNSTSGFLGKIVNGYNDGFVATAPVGSFPANARGLYDMGGNVAEWINDFYDIQLGAAGRAEIDPLGPKTGKFHVIRGSSWAHGTVTELRLSYRDYNTKARDDVGFRIARYLE